MIGQPLGCILVLLLGALAVAIAFGGIWCVSFVAPDLVSWNAGTYLLLLPITIVAFHLLMEFCHRLEIRVFLRKRGVRITRIRAFRTHYRVYYFQDGHELSGKWPEDFVRSGPHPSP